MPLCKFRLTQPLVNQRRDVVRAGVLRILRQRVIDLIQRKSQPIVIIILKGKL